MNVILSNASVFHDCNQDINGAMFLIVCDIGALTGDDIQKSPVCQIYNSVIDNRAGNLHLSGKIAFRRKLFPDGKFSGENHRFNFCNEQLF